jgi:hypothetical protein
MSRGAPKGSQNALGGRGNPNPSPETRLTGGKPGNRGGVGQPSNALRANLRDLVASDGIDRIAACMKGESDSTALRATEVALKFGVGEAKSQMAPEEWLEATIMVAADFIPPNMLEEFARVLSARVKELA